MIRTKQTIRCANCGNPNNVAVFSVIDAQENPQAKSALVSEQINKFPCPNCGAVNVVDSPLLYHDAAKELLIAYVPMGVAATQGKSDERIIGDLMNSLTNELPKDQFKAYMFSPKRALTMNGLIEQILEADGITPEMMAQQRARVEMIQEMVEADSLETLSGLIREHDDEIDMQFFQTLSLMAQRIMSQGPQDIAEAMLQVQEALIQYSTFGKEIAARQEQQQAMVQAVANDIEALGEGAERTDFIDLALQYGVEDERLQALVGLVRPAFDYQLLQEFSLKIEAATEEERPALEAVRDRLVQLTQVIDAQARQSMQQTAQILQQILESPDPAAMLEANVQILDEQFMSILAANLQEAEKRGNTAVVAQLQQVYQKAVELLQSQMSPELRLINELLSIEDDAELTARLQLESQNYGAELMDLVNGVEQMLIQQGQTAILPRLHFIRDILAQTSANWR